MKKSNVFLDFDDLIVKTKPAVISYVYDRYGVKITDSEYYNENGSLHDVIKRYNPHLSVTFNELYLDYGKNFLASLEWNRNIPLMEDVQEIIPMLSRKYNLFIVTARQKIGLEVIDKLTVEFFGKCFKEIHCVWEWVDDVGFCESSKKSFISKVQGEKVVFIDDSKKEIKKMENILPTYLFDPEGLCKPENGINIVRSWKEIGTILL